MKKEYYEMIGKRYGKIVVRGVVYRGSRVYCECECDCGVVKEINAVSIIRGKSRSCGCGRGSGRKLKGEDVMSGVMESGVSGYARKMGVSRETVYKEMRRIGRGDGGSK